MSVVAKALDLLSFFSTERTEIGLSEFHKLARRDKATTLRHLRALESAELLEQDPRSRAYRIGPAALRLARLREAATPRRAAVLEPLASLAEATGETAHASLLADGALQAIGSKESARHSTRVVISETELPLHATASGTVVLAFGPPDLAAAVSGALTRYTERTPVTPEALAATVAAARRDGFAEARDSFEAGVHGLAAPVFDASGAAVGAVAVATPSGRMTPALAARIRTALAGAAREITRRWGGTVPPELDRAWADAREPETAT